MTKIAVCCAAAAGTTNQRTCVQRTATGTTATTPTTTWDFVLPVRLRWPELMHRSNEWFRALQRACTKVSMIGRPVLKTELHAEECCQDDCPAVRLKLLAAGLFLSGLPLLCIAQQPPEQPVLLTQQQPTEQQQELIQQKQQTQEPVQQTQQSNSTETTPPRCSASDTSGPEMVVLPGDTYRMGSPDNEAGRSEDEGPEHPVTVASFAIAVCEVTVAEFRRFTEATDYVTEAESSKRGCRHNSEAGTTDWEERPGFNWSNALHGDSDDDHPVVCVSWNDAVAYADWLSQRFGVTYRLPTEAEWEYAARAGIEDARYYRDRSQCLYVNAGDVTTREIYSEFSSVDCVDGFVHTAPVASFAPNNWGLYDMLGNAWEWTEDCWHGDYTGAPLDGSAWLEADNGDCDRRVLRGGGWFSKPENLRAANRSWNDRVNAYFVVGFRLARTLSPSAL